VKGVSDISQNASFYIKNLDNGYISSLEKYKKDYYKEWQTLQPYVEKKQASWANRVFHPPYYYGENFQKVSQQFYTKVIQNTNFKHFATLNKKAFTLKRVNVRALPTQRMLFLNPQRAGEGFPFDYLQNSSIAGYKPVFVSHYSKDKAWVFIEASFAYGWIPSKDIAFIGNKEAKQWKESKQNLVIKDNEAIYNKKGEFLFYSQIGQMIPLISPIKLPKESYHKGILRFTGQNINRILSRLQKNIYGWGGLYGQRDCSATIRDFFAPFGIWLPRNSSKQSKIGKIISFEGMSDQEKIVTIKKYAIPFQTLLYKQGHIVLYVGIFTNKVIIFHNTWGIKTSYWGKVGRFIIGKPIFSTLDFGQNIKGYEKKSSILHHLKSMNILTK
jgi:hypothetical protein